jgi:hypothetical protein
MSGALVFSPGQVSKTVSVFVNGDTTKEPTETFTVQLSNPSNAGIAGIADGTGLGTVVNDD